MERIALFIAMQMLMAWSAAYATEQPYAVVYERDVTVKMRDGVTLRADIYRPESLDKFPVLLERTPYDKSGGVAFGLKAAARGYVVVVQDVRGRYASAGDWYPFKNESNDGYDTIEWAAALPYSNGKVGMFGRSYIGATQLLAAIVHPPHLAGICPVTTASDYYNGWTYQGGAFQQWFNESWTSILAQDTLDRALANATNAVNGIWTTPLSKYPLFNLQQAPLQWTEAAQIAPYFLDWLEHPSYDAYWKQISIAEHFSDITVPALHIAAWYDIFLSGSLRNYSGIKTNGGSEDARHQQRLWVIVGGHAGNGPQIGDLDFGETSRFDENETTISWYDYLFKSAQNEFASGKPVKLFVLGTNQWRQENEWPLERARNARYFLHSAGRANSLKGNGSLSSVPPGKELPDRYVYDPVQPVPTIGGPLCCDREHWEPGPRDQQSVEARADVLVYSTSPLAREMEVTGPISVELYAKSSATDTDFTAKLVDVWPNGFAQNLTDGIVRGRYRDSAETPALMNPGQVYRLTIDLRATSNVFRQGHVVRLEISSSNFPRFDRNPNTGALRYPATSVSRHTEWVQTSATNTILHDVNHPSALILPVVPTP
jgi:putative CocE/NonD family hydrolase